MAQQVRDLVVKPDNLEPTWGRGESRRLQVVLWDPYTCILACAHLYTHKIIKWKNLDTWAWIKEFWHMEAHKGWLCLYKVPNQVKLWGWKSEWVFSRAGRGKQGLFNIDRNVLCPNYVMWCVCVCVRVGVHAAQLRPIIKHHQSVHLDKLSCAWWEAHVNKPQRLLSG